MILSQPRNRTKGSFTTPLTTQTYGLWHSCAMPAWTLLATSNLTLKVGSVESMSDVVVPGFHLRRSRGEVFFNPLSYTLQEQLFPTVGNGWHEKSLVTPSTCSGIQRYAESRVDGASFAASCQAFFGAPAGLLPVVPLISEGDRLGLQTETSTACLANRGTSDSNLFESIAEIRQTLSLIRRPLNSLNLLLNKASTKRERARGAASSWLTYRYGILPVVRDVGSVIDGLKKKVGNVRKTTRAQRSLTKSSVSSYSYTDGGGRRLDIGIQTTDTLLTRAMSLDEYVTDLYGNIGFETKGLVTLPWELIPYSFVADWFVNFGDFLKAIVPLPGVTQLGSSLTTKRDTVSQYFPMGNTLPATKSLQRPTTGLIKARSKSSTRTSMTSPGIVIKSDFRFDEATRMADAVSLLTLRMDSLFKGP